MTASASLAILEQGLLLAVLLSAAPVVAAALAGTLAGLLRAMTSIQDDSISAVAKIAAVAATLLFLGNPILQTLTNFGRSVLLMIPGVQ